MPTNSRLCQAVGLPVTHKPRQLCTYVVNKNGKAFFPSYNFDFASSTNHLQSLLVLLEAQKICQEEKGILHLICSDLPISCPLRLAGGGGGVTPYNGLYGESPSARGTFLRLQVYTRVGISQVEVYEKVEKSVISVRKRTKKG